MDMKVLVFFVALCVGIAIGQNCNDANRNCRSYPQSYCTIYQEFMKRNCARRCGYCSEPTTTKPPDCIDVTSSSNCEHWKSKGFCAADNKYYNYMKDNCKKTCGFCGSVTTPRPTQPTEPTQPTQPTGPTQPNSCSASQKLRSCSFDSDTCDFIDVPFDDEKDFQIKSSGGTDGKGYISAQGRGAARLIFPLELIVPHNSDYGNMCLQFYYRMESGARLFVHEVRNAKRYPKTTKVQLSGLQRSWKKVSFTFRASQYNHILIEASSGKVDIDNARFCDGSC